MYFYETLCELNLLEVLEKTITDVTHYSEYHKYLLSLKEGTQPENDSPCDENPLKEKIKVVAIEILISCLTIVPSKLSLISHRPIKELHNQHKSEVQRTSSSQ